MSYIKEKVRDIFSEEKDIRIEYLNYDYQNYQSLNEGCGAEHVQKERKLPCNFRNVFSDSQNNQVEFIKNITLDGDVDRIIY